MSSADELNPSRYMQPREAESLLPIAGGLAYLEHRGPVSLIWDEDWHDSRHPLGVMQGKVWPEMAEAWLAGYQAGGAKGEAIGRAEGFANCQAGLRALLGAASAADVATLLRAAQEAGA